MDFFEKYKKIFIVTGFILLILLLGYLLYALFFKPAAPAALPGSGLSTTTTGSLPQSGAGAGQITPSGQSGGLPQTGGGEPVSQSSPVALGGLTQTISLNQAPSLGATLSADGNDLFFYNQTDGKFYRLTKEGQATELNGNVFHEVKKITWSPDKNKAILEYPDEAKIIYDFKNSRQISLPKHWQDFAFSPDGSKIVLKSLADDPANRWLAIADEQGGNARSVAALGDKNDTVYPSWSPNNQTVAMYTEGQGYDRQAVYFVGLHEENFKSLTVEGRGFEPQWSPRGDRLLYSVYSSGSDLKPELWITSAQGDNIGSNRIKLGVQTWADKCVFASAAEIYCAVPEKLEEGAGLFRELAKNSSDNLYKIDVQTGLKKLLAMPDGDFSMSGLIVSANGYYLYFTDANTGTINKIKLK